MKAVHLLFILLFGITLSVKTHAQEEDPPTDDLGNVSDAFQEYFFEALKQKGIENYERALVALNKAKTEAEKKQVNQAVVYFEMAKNLSRLERYDEAIENFKKVRNTEKDNIAVLEGMYDAYYQQANYAQAIPIVQLLAKHNADYKEDLLNLYHSTKQYDKALSLLDDLDESWGESPQRNVLRRQIYKITGNSQAAITNLKDKIGKHPKNEQDYLNLIFLYSEQGEKEKAFATAETLLKNEPKSELVHLALYKFYLDKGETENALNSMSVVFAASQIETKSKYQVLSDFISFVEKNPVYEAKLLETVAQLGEENPGEIYSKVGQYYTTKGNKEQALVFYEKANVADPGNFNTLKNTLLLQIDTQNFEAAQQLSASALEVFPAQPILYLLNGVANIGLSKTDDAIQMLETGLDFLLDNPTMQKDFYTQLGKAHTARGNTVKAKVYAEKAAALKI